MQRIILVVCLLTFFGRVQHLQAESRRLEVIDAPPGSAKDASTPWRALANLLVELNAAAAFSPAGPGVLRASHCLNCRCASITNTDGGDDANRAEVLKLKAEQAKMQAERAKIEAEILELQMQKLKPPGSGEDPTEEQDASSASPAPPVASIRVPGSVWPEGKNKKLHRFITEDDPTYQISPSFFRTRENLVLSQTEGEHEGTFRVTFTLPDQESQPKTLELLQTTKGTPSFGAIRIPVESLVEIIGPPAVKRIGDDIIKQITTEFDGRPEHLVIADIRREGGPFQKVDIIRAVSMPDPATSQAQESDNAEKPWWEKINDSIGKAIVGSLPPCENGMVILDGSFFQAFEAAVKENLRVSYPKSADVVLVIERPDPEWLKYLNSKSTWR